jgi:hypothetical protein
MTKRPPNVRIVAHLVIFELLNTVVLLSLSLSCGVAVFTPLFFISDTSGTLGSELFRSFVVLTALVTPCDARL